MADIGSIIDLIGYLHQRILKNALYSPDLVCMKYSHEIRCCNSQDGAVMVEMAAAAGVLFAVLLVSIDFSLQIYRFHVAAHVTSEISRRAAVNAVGGTNEVERANNVVTMVRDLAGKMSLGIAAESVSVCPINSATIDAGCGTNSTGRANGYFILFIDQPVRTIIGIPLNITAGSIIRNEPF